MLSQYYGRPLYLKFETLNSIDPWVRYGSAAAEAASCSHAIQEVAAISYLMGKGYSPRLAHQIVSSWELGEPFYPG